MWPETRPLPGGGLPPMAPFNSVGPMYPSLLRCIGGPLDGIMLADRGESFHMEHSPHLTVAGYSSYHQDPSGSYTRVNRWYVWRSDGHEAPQR